MTCQTDLVNGISIPLFASLPMQENTNISQYHSQCRCTAGRYSCGISGILTARCGDVLFEWQKRGLIDKTVLMIPLCIYLFCEVTASLYKAIIVVDNSVYDISGAAFHVSFPEAFLRNSPIM